MATSVNGRYTVDEKLDISLTTALADLATVETDISDLDAHFHAKLLTSPNLAAGIEVISNNTAWLLGSISLTILTVASGTISDIHFVDVYGITDAGQYQLDIVHSVEGTITSVPFEKKSVTADDYARMYFGGSYLCGPGTFKAQLASSVGHAHANVKLGYHLEPA